jgi:hypothetical protein
LFIKPGAMLPGARHDLFFDSAEAGASFDVPVLPTLEEL